MEEDEEKLNTIDSVAESFQEACQEKLGERLKAFYVAGSYAFGEISLDKPDLNYILMFKEKGEGDDYLALGDIIKSVSKKYEDKALIKPEFRPFRYIYPPITKEGYMITLNPILMNMQEKDLQVPFNLPKFFLKGIKSSRKLLYGEDALAEVEIGKVTQKHVREIGMRELGFWELPLVRAPAQYRDNDQALFFSEVLSRAKSMLYLGVEAVMTEEELANDEYVHYAENKDDMVELYEARYSEEVGEMATQVLDARKNFTEYKEDRRKAEDIFKIAVDLPDVIRRELRGHS